ncbi:MAG TPA: hypothetical protein VFZ53_17725, partial [Polyangiaceae bacterium]
VAASGTAPSLVRDTCGLHAFVRASNDRIYTATETGGSWSAWSGFGWAFSSSPGAGAILTTTESCAIMVVARRSTTNALMYRVKRGGVWSAAWATIPGLAPVSFDDVRQPAVVFGKSSTAAAAVHVLFPTDDSKLRWTKLTSLANNTWTAWTVLPNGANGQVQSSPSATSTIVGNGGHPIRIAVRGGNGKLWNTGLSAIGAPDWTQIGDLNAWNGGGLTSRLCGDVPTYYATVVDGFVSTNRGPNLLWEGWDAPPTVVTATSAPAIAASACNAYDIAFQRQDGRFTRVKVQ